MERYKWNLIELTEVRWRGIREKTTKGGHKIWHSGNDLKHEKGVGFLVHKHSVSAVTKCTPISDRIIEIRIQAKAEKMTILQVYAPTSDHSNEKMEKFYEELKKQLRKNQRDTYCPR